MDAQAIAAAADHLFRQSRSGQPLQALPADLRSDDLSDAYRAQDRFQIARLKADGRPLAGWKIALTTPQMQAFVGIDHPCEGGIFAHQVHASPTKVRAADFTRLAVETEIALRIGADLGPGARPHDADSVADTVAAAMAASELVDDMAMNYDEPDSFAMIGANALNQGCVLGPAVSDWRSLDLAALRGQMKINGAVVGEGQGRDALGHPLNALAWLANALNARGRRLIAGDIVMTGSVVTTKFPVVGDTVVSAVESLGEAELLVV